MININKKHIPIYSLLINATKSQVSLIFALILLNLILGGILLIFPVSANNLTDTCQGRLDWRRCYGLELATLTREKSFDFAIEVMRQLPNLDPKTADCHILAHTATAAEVAKDPSNWENLIKKIDVLSCNYGFVHGIIEGRSQFDPKFVLNEQTIPEICRIMMENKKARGVDQSCTHIMGHVLLAEENGKIEDALEVCKKIPSELQYQCFAGTFMENFTRENLVAHEISDRIPWNEETIKLQEQICSEYRDLTSEACWMEISHMYSVFFKNDPPRVYNACSRAPNIKFRNACYQHAVAGLITEGPLEDEHFISVCKPYIDDPLEYNKCTFLVVDSMLNASVHFSDRSLKYCTVITESFKEACFRYIARSLSLRVTKEEQIRLCEAAPENYKSICSGL